MLAIFDDLARDDVRAILRQCFLNLTFFWGVKFCSVVEKSSVDGINCPQVIFSAEERADG